MKASYPLHINPASTNANPPIIPPLQKLPRQPHLLRKVRTMVFEMLMQHMQKFLRTIFNIAIKGLTTSDFDELRKIKELYDAVLADLHNECKKSCLSHLEKIVSWNVAINSPLGQNIFWPCLYQKSIEYQIHII